MNGKLQVHGHCNGLKTTLLFALMWGVIMLIWWATGGSQSTLGFYILIGLGSTFASYWFSDRLAIASMHAQEVSEQEAPVLYKIVRELSAKAGKPMPRIYIAPTMSPNAFATGRNERHAAVCCTQGILQMLNEREIRGVLGHELMHVYNRDILTSAIASAMATVISYLGYSLMYFGGGRSRDDREGSDSGGLGLLGVLLSTILAPIAASLIQMAISRTREYDADEDGSKLTEDPEGARFRVEQDFRRRGRDADEEDRGNAVGGCDDDRQSVFGGRFLQAVFYAPADLGSHCAADADGAGDASAGRAVRIFGRWLCHERRCGGGYSARRTFCDGWCRWAAIWNAVWTRA